MKFRAVEIQHQWFERLAMRMFFAFALERLIPRSLAVYTLTNPNGFARFVDFHFLLESANFAIARYLFLAALVLYVLRLWWWLALPFLMLFTIVVGTIINSQGAIGHYSQIVSLVLCAQTTAYFSRRRADSAARENRVIFWSQQAIVATYLVSALTKILRTHGLWILQTPKVAVQIIKTTEQDYYDRLDLASRASGQAVADWMVHHPLLVMLALGAGFFLELTAPLALLGRVHALAYGVALIAFHEGIERVMKLGFPFNEYLLAIYLINAPFWISFGTRKLFARASGPTAR